MVVNPQISLMFKVGHDRISNVVSKSFESWIMQDQILFKLLLSMISEGVLPCVISCKHSFKVWDKVHKHYNSQMKAHVHQLRSQLKTSTKVNRSVSEYVLHIRTMQILLFLYVIQYLSKIRLILFSKDCLKNTTCSL